MRFVQQTLMANNGYSLNRLIVLVCVLLDFVHSLSIGKVCTTKGGAVGECISLGDCNEATVALFTKGIVPESCGLEISEPMFCCIRNVSSKLQVSSVGEKSKHKCIEYAKLSDVDILIFPGEDISKFLIKCPSLNNDFRSPIKAKPKEFPHMAAIGFDNNENNVKQWLCSGSLISEQFVLTVAKCLSNHAYGTAKYVRLGDLNLDSNIDDAAPQEFKIVEIFKHPEYKRPSYHNDIALVKMDKTANLNAYVRPACLNTNSKLTTRRPVQTGWVRVTMDSEINPHLLKDSLDYFSHSECNSTYHNNGIDYEKQVCAGSHTAKVGCMLGTGGPLQVPHEEVHCSYKIVGISSFGKNCVLANIPEGFTRVSTYIEWIEGIVWP